MAAARVYGAGRQPSPHQVGEGYTKGVRDEQEIWVAGIAFGPLVALDSTPLDTNPVSELILGKAGCHPEVGDADPELQASDEYPVGVGVAACWHPSNGVILMILCQYPNGRFCRPPSGRGRQLCSLGVWGGCSRTSPAVQRSGSVPVGARIP